MCYISKMKKKPHQNECKWETEWKYKWNFIKFQLRENIVNLLSFLIAFTLKFITITYTKRSFNEKKYNFGTWTSFEGHFKLFKTLSDSINLIIQFR